MTADDKPKRNPVTGRYKPTKRALEFRKVVRARRAEVAEVAKQQRQINRAALKAVIDRALAAEKAARAAERDARAAEAAAQEAAAPTDSTAAPETPADSELGTEDSTEPSSE